MQPPCSTVTQTVTSLPPQFLRFPTEALNEQPDIQPLIARFRILYLQHIDCDDEISLKIQDVMERFIQTDCSKIRPSEVIKVAQDCRSQFAKLLCNDFDHAPLTVPIVIRGWILEKWQVLDYIQLDQYFGQRQIAISPFDQEAFPEELPRHEFMQAIIDLLKTIPEMLQEANRPTKLVITTGKLSQQEADQFAPENNMIVAFQRYEMWKKLAKASVQEKKSRAIITELEIDIAARKLSNENLLQEIISQEAQRMLTYFEERQKATQVQLDEAEQARIEIENLKTQLDESTRNIRQLRTDIAVQEKRSEGLQQQMNGEHAKYIKLAQELQEMHNSCRRRPWWKFWK